MVSFNHVSDFVFREDTHCRYLELRLPPSLHLLEVHEDSLAGRVVVNDEYGSLGPLDPWEEFVLLDAVGGRKRLFDLALKIIHGLRPHHFPRPFDIECVFHLSWPTSKDRSAVRRCLFRLVRIRNPPDPG